MARTRTGLPRRGQTFYQGTTPPTSWTESASAEGTCVMFKDVDPTDSAVGGDALRSNMDVTCVLVRNVGGTTATAKRWVKWKSGSEGRRIDGYAITDFGLDVAGVVDEHLSGGIPANDMGWIVVEGPTLATTAPGADGTNTFSAGDRLVALTAASSQAATAGYFQPTDAVATSNATTNMEIAIAIIGKAMSAATAAESNTDKLIYVNCLKG